MAIQYLSGNRATGTESDRTGMTTYSAKSWIELGRTTLSSAGDTIDVTGLSTANYPYLMVLQDEIGSGSITGFTSFNADSGSNYAYRTSENGASDGTSTSQANIRLDRGTPNNFIVANISNKADQEKIVIGSCVGIGAAGASNAPQRWEAVGKWANTSDSITSVKISNASSGDFASGSEVVVLGSKSSGTDTSKGSFWQELADVELSSAASSIDSGTFTAKKYLWIEFSGVGSNGSSYPRLRFNSDSGNNFAYRQSMDGGSDNTQTSQNHMNTTGNVGAFNHYFNSFVVNKSDKEKLVITQGVDSNTAGAGNAPRRREVVGKWANTSDSITSVQVLDLGSYNFSSATLKVWGSD